MVFDSGLSGTGSGAFKGWAVPEHGMGKTGTSRRPCEVSVRAGAESSEVLGSVADNRDCSHLEQLTMMNPIGDLRRLRSEHNDWLLTALAGVLILLIFVFAPLQAVGITAFHLFAFGLLLAIIGGMVIISDSPTALVLCPLRLLRILP